MADSDYNPITIDKIPTSSSLLSGDKIISFERDGSGSLVPKLYDVVDLSSCAVLKDDLDDVKAKVSQVSSFIESCMMNLTRTYITASDAKAAYETNANMVGTLNKLEKKTTFNGRLKDKADIEDLEMCYDKLLEEISRMKAVLGDGTWKNKDDNVGRGYKFAIISRAHKEAE